MSTELPEKVEQRQRERETEQRREKLSEFSEYDFVAESQHCIVGHQPESHHCIVGHQPLWDDQH